MLALPEKLHVATLVIKTVALDAIRALPDIADDANFVTPPVTVALAALLALPDRLDAGTLVTVGVASDDALPLSSEDTFTPLVTKAALLALA